MAEVTFGRSCGGFFTESVLKRRLFRPIVSVVVRLQSPVLLSVLTALANSLALLSHSLALVQSECGKTRDLRWTQRWFNKPGDDPSDIDGRRRDHMLELRFW